MRKLITFSAIVVNIVLFFVMVSTSITAFAWGDNSGLEDGRPEFTINQINEGALGDTITFNSISDNPMGHEFNFVSAREDTDINLGENNIWNANDITVEDGKYYLIRIYVHNNSPNGYDAVAKDVKVAFNIPGDTANKIQVDGFIESSNATPTEYWDYVNFNSDHLFHLVYITGSARLYNNGIGNVKNADERNGISISDDILNSASGGIPIGFKSIESGEVPGCFEFDNFVTILVKAVYDYEYSIETHVRPAGTKGDNWTKNLQANIGDRLEYQIEYENTSDETQYDVILRDYLPDNIEYIPGTTRLYNSLHDGDVYDSDRLFTDQGINIGNYEAGVNGYIRFNAIVVDNDLDEKSNTLINWGQGWVSETLEEDYTGIVLYKDSKFTTTITMLAFLIMTCLLVIAALLQKTYKNRHL